ncbi:Tropomodulin-1 [Papilio machaon]|uniref:Tropomodulin-1 n=1 Tax=Papilio machaon TaxID=76193 RepID=A0A194QTS4_PAPMA|nr:Tropomodulin-1 [Papilio machaon]
MTTPAKLYGRELSAYDEVDVDELLAKLSQEELTMLAKEVDPDDNFLPPSQRNNYACEKDPTGPLNRKKLIEHINKQALETPDRPEVKPYVPGVIRGKKWIPPPPPEKVRDAEEQITIDLGDEYEQALTSASQEEIIDLAEQSVKNHYKVQRHLTNISDEKFEKLFEGLKSNTHLEVLCLVNVGLTDRTAQLLADALRANSTLRVVNVETNFISPPGVVQLVAALLTTTSVEEFRASNQRSQVLGNKIEMEITSLVEQNPTLLRLGLHLEYSDARHRVASHLQRNIDRNCRMQKRPRASLSLRLPRSRPSGVGVDADLLVTPPSVEEKTPTREPAKTVITENVHGSIVVEAKSPDTDIGSGLQEDRFPSAELSNNPDPARPYSPLESVHPQPELGGGLDPVSRRTR